MRAADTENESIGIQQRCGIFLFIYLFKSLYLWVFYLPVSFAFQPKLYKTVMEDVINEVRELFLDEGVDEQVLMELKTVSEGIKPDTRANRV